ncbi:unnamed protein product [Blepharisma stoltei]|uniref:SAM domain-containing protein n=1 Tax=Blepharisma stoltei TaxID=1481888 RepID=A0AAU9JS34_9CILI|nr:unnamed protein product [Blepharisma stoltei]
MKYSKAGILKKKVSAGSDVLEEEAKLMEAKLAQLRDFMKNEKTKREQAPKQKEGTRWRSGTQNKPNTNYADLVLSYKPKPPSSQSAKRPEKTDKFIPTSALIEDSSPKIEETSKANPIMDFLISCGMEKYYNLLIENGIDELEILLELTEDHLNNLNIPLGHRLKLLKKIRENKNQSSQSERTLEALPYPQQVELPHPSTSEGTRDAAIGDSLLETNGDFNELESAAMFREALDNFRKGGRMTQHDPNQRDESQELKKVRFVDPVTPDMLPKEGSKLFYDGAWQPEQSAIPEKADEGIGSNKPIIIEKKSCWSCYKIFSKVDGVLNDGKEFCSKECSSKHVVSKVTTCKCGRTFLKTNGIFNKGFWFCKEKCVEEDEEKREKEQAMIKATNEKRHNQGGSVTNSTESEDFVVIDPITGDPISEHAESSQA